MTNPLALGVADAVLKRHCENYQVGSMTTIEIHPGEKAQILHRDGDFYPIAIPGVEFQLQAMWALTDFTDENGATRIVTDRDVLKGVKNADTEAFENIDESKVSQAVMPKGSVFFLASVNNPWRRGEHRVNTLLGFVYLLLSGVGAPGRLPILAHSKGSRRKLSRKCQ